MSVNSDLDEVTKLRYIIETQRLINSVQLQPDELMRVICERAQDITGSTGAVVELAEADEMVYKAACGSAQIHVGTRLEISTSLSGRCLRLGSPLICFDTEDDIRVDRDACRRIGIRSMIVVPLLKRDIPVGVLKVMSDQPHRFQAQDVELLSEMAAFIADSLTHASDYRRDSHNALHDPLTGLPNRHLLMDCLEQACVRANANGTSVAVFLMDLDGFKLVNDRYGHPAGDHVLRMVAHGLRAVLRQEDTLARLGGDEFVIVCEGATEEDAFSILNRVSSAVRLIAGATPEYAHIGASIGLAWRGHDGLSPDELLSAADASMYRVKKAGRV